MYVSIGRRSLIARAVRIKLVKEWIGDCILEAEDFVLNTEIAGGLCSLEEFSSSTWINEQSCLRTHHGWVLSSVPGRHRS